MNEVVTDKKPILSKKKIIIYLIIALFLIASFLFWFFMIRVDESKLNEIETKIQNNEGLSKYFTTISFSRSEIDEVVESQESKSYPYYLLGSLTDEYTKLNGEEKYEVYAKLKQIIKEDLLIECGYKKYCDTVKISMFNYNSTETDGYSLDLYNDEFVHNYEDENGDLQTETIHVSGNTNTNTTQSKPLILEETSCNRGGNYMYAKGYVKNNSDRTLSFIEIQADFFDSTGNIVDTDYTYAVGSEGLVPEGRKSYEIMTPFNDSVTDCKYKITDYQ